LHPFKKGQHILFSGVTKGRRGPRVELEREKMSDRITPDSFFSDTHAFVALQPVRFFFFKTSSYSRVFYYKMYSLFTHSAHTKKLLSVGVCFFERVFRPLLVTQLFHAKKEEKKEKKFSPFFFVCKSKPNKTLF
jgi:hypothetical protein